MRVSLELQQNVTVTAIVSELQQAGQVCDVDNVCCLIPCLAKVLAQVATSTLPAKLALQEVIVP